jgi:cytochrome c biogenesis protein CcmG, thiol:disulfide interchange protein DsbE
VLRRNGSMPRGSQRAAVAAAVMLAALLLAACGDDGGGARGGGAAPAAPSTAGLPRALANNVAKADQYVGEGESDFRNRLAELKGHPVVVNQWASWCGSCRFEFPFFREATRRHRKDVAFLGLDSQDSKEDGQAFLEELPVGFPSVFDGDASIAAALGGAQAWPTTFFFDESGKQVHVKIGAYATPELLEQDIQRYVLGS